MNTLKRQRTDLEPKVGGQKRACSSQFHSDYVRYTRATQFQTSKPLRVQAPIAVPKRCIHKIATACSLTQTTCCACLDARPDGFNFARYIDGHSWGLTRYRWLYYCTDCRAYWSAQDDLGLHRRRPLGLLRDEQGVPDVIRISCMAGHFDIIPSLDLTLDGLRVEVARLMQCDPIQIMASDIAMYNGGVVLGMSDDDALASRATHVNFTRVTTAESEDVEMDDVHV